MDWKRKLGSRKFWALLAGVTTSICVLVGAGEDTASRIAGLIGTVGSAAVYMLAESYVDGKKTDEK